MEITNTREMEMHLKTGREEEKMVQFCTYFFSVGVQAFEENNETKINQFMSTVWYIIYCLGFTSVQLKKKRKIKMKMI